MQSPAKSETGEHHEPWYKYGVAFLSIEMLIAVLVSAYALVMTFHGMGGFLGKH